MKKSFLKLVVLGFALTSMLFLSTCKKDKEDKLTVTCQGDCRNFSFKIGNETGAISMNMTTSLTYDSYGNVATANSTGTITYQASGNTYQLKESVNFQTCKYTVTVNNESSCGN